VYGGGEVPSFEAVGPWKVVDLVQDGEGNKVGGFEFCCGVICGCASIDCNFVLSEAYGHRREIGLSGTMGGHLEVGDNDFFWVLDGVDALVV